MNSERTENEICPACLRERIKIRRVDNKGHSFDTICLNNKCQMSVNLKVANTWEAVE